MKSFLRSRGGGKSRSGNKPPLPATGASRQLHHQQRPQGRLPAPHTCPSAGQGRLRPALSPESFRSSCPDPLRRGGEVETPALGPGAPFQHKRQVWELARNASSPRQGTHSHSGVSAGPARRAPHNAFSWGEREAAAAPTNFTKAASQLILAPRAPGSLYRPAATAVPNARAHRRGSFLLLPRTPCLFRSSPEAVSVVALPGVLKPPPPRTGSRRRLAEPNLRLRQRKREPPLGWLARARFAAAGRKRSSGQAGGRLSPLPPPL